MQVASVASTSTAIMADSAGSRQGTAAKVIRTWPVAYSPVMRITPSAPIASSANPTPARLLARRRSDPLDLPPAVTDHRRVLAVLKFLGG
jgi:hypothetical protein